MEKGFSLLRQYLVGCPYALRFDESRLAPSSLLYSFLTYLVRSWKNNRRQKRKDAAVGDAAMTHYFPNLKVRIRVSPW